MLNLVYAADAIEPFYEFEDVFWSNGRAIVMSDSAGFGIGYDAGDGTQCRLPFMRWRNFDEAKQLAMLLADYMLG